MKRPSLQIGHLPHLLGHAVERPARYAARLARNGFSVEVFPRGHFYSPLPSLRDVRRSALRPPPDPCAGDSVRLDRQGQLDLIRQLAPLVPSASVRRSTDRYQQNTLFTRSDALTLTAMLRYLRPARIIEVGSGYSSALMLDVRDTYLQDRSPQLTFIEPHPQRLLKLLRDSDQQTAALRVEPVQQVPLAVFDELQAGDLLFIDSSHVAKYGSDVNYLFFEVIPRLRTGVMVHVHDIHWPFEYPVRWMERGWAWNESYLLHAFLQFNDAWRVRLWGSYLCHEAAEELRQIAPALAEGPCGSIYLERVR